MRGNASGSHSYSDSINGFNIFITINIFKHFFVGDSWLDTRVCEPFLTQSQGSKEPKLGLGIIKTIPIITTI
jgi:hypothetical protein